MVVHFVGKNIFNRVLGVNVAYSHCQQGNNEYQLGYRLFIVVIRILLLFC